jgi:hypothetical protein
MKNQIYLIGILTIASLLQLSCGKANNIFGVGSNIDAEVHRFYRYLCRNSYLCTMKTPSEIKKKILLPINSDWKVEDVKVDERLGEEEVLPSYALLHVEKGDRRGC